MNIKNNVQLIGRLGAEPEVKILKNGGKLAKFSLAISEKYTNKSGEEVRNTQWHNVIVWGNMATMAERMLRKGYKVTVEGKLAVKSYTDKEGKTRNITQIVANEFLLISSLNAA